MEYTILFKVVREAFIETVKRTRPEFFRLDVALFEFIEQIDCVVQDDAVVSCHHRLEINISIPGIYLKSFQELIHEREEKYLATKFCFVN